MACTIDAGLYSTHAIKDDSYIEQRALVVNVMAAAELIPPSYNFASSNVKIVLSEICQSPLITERHCKSVRNRCAH